VSYVDVPADAFKQAMVGAGTPAAYADAYLDLIRYYRQGTAATVSDDVRHVTGKPPRSFEQFANEHVTAF
jgi:hypothetical protein